MNSSQKKWYIKSPQLHLQNELSIALDISPTLSQLLVNRGITDVEQANCFLNPTLSKMSDPSKIAGIIKAYDRLLEAIASKEKVLVFGDYDVDGLTSTSLMINFLTDAGLESNFLIPNRIDTGYGLKEAMINDIVKYNCSLVVTVDCGIKSIKEVDILKGLGIDVIITDHHQPDSEIPAACAVVNPKLGSPPAALDLAGVGVVFKLLQLLSRQIFNEDYIYSMLDLVALGTVADVVPLFGDNRILVKQGLKHLNSSNRPGIKALLSVCGYKQGDITEEVLAFGLGPRINSAGRMGDSIDALELLLTSSIQRASELAKELNKTNNERRLIEEAIYKQAEAMIAATCDTKKDKIIVLSSELWHPGVIGIVASRLVRAHHRPVILFVIEGDVAKGSARSIDGCNIYDAIKACSHHLIECGGHDQAAGLSIETVRLETFSQDLNAWAAANLTPDVFKPIVYADAEVLFSELDDRLANELQLLAPFGKDNNKPILVAKNVDILSSRKIGKQKNHLKMSLVSCLSVMDAVGFNMGDYSETAAVGKKVDLAFLFEKNLWNGRENLQLNLVDLKTPKNSDDIIYESNLKPNMLLKDRIEEYASNQLTDIVAYLHKALSDGITIFLIAETVNASKVLYNYWKSYWAANEVSCFCLSGANTTGEIIKILSDPPVDSIIFLSLTLWSNFSKEASCTKTQAVLMTKKQISLACGIIDNKHSKIEAFDFSKNDAALTVDKPDYLLQERFDAKVIDVNRRTAIRTLNLLSLFDTLQIIKNRFPSIDVSVWHEDLSYPKQMEMISRFNSGQSNLILTTTSLLGDSLMNVEDEYILGFPFDALHWELLNPSADRLVFFERNIIRLNKLLEGIYPTRKSLMKVYALARKHGKRIIDLDYTHMGSFLSASSYKVLVNIFNELNLSGLPSDRQVSLEESWRYQENRYQHQAADAIFSKFHLPACTMIVNQ